MHSPYAYSVVLAPFHDPPGVAVNAHQSDLPRVDALSGSVSPTDIARAVISIIIDAIKSGFGKRLFAHII
jgi:hypothetical protein